MWAHPVANFTYSQICGYNVHFTDQSIAIATDGVTATIAGWSWDFNGDAIQDSNLQNPEYTFSSTGIKSVKLTVTDSHGCTNTVTKIITVDPANQATAGSNSPVCEGSTIKLTGGPTGMNSYSWTGPNGYTSNLQNPIISPATSANDGVYELTITDPDNCQSTATTSVTVPLNPVASAGLDQTVCDTATTVSLTGTNTGGAATYLWTTSGTGTFLPSPATSLSEQYTPSNADKATGSVTITLKATGTTPCSGTSTDSMLITIQPRPTASAGPDQTICKGSTVTLAGLADHYGTVTWTGGAGTFTPNVHTLTATYTPTQAEINAGFVTLTLTATALPPCPEETDQMTITMHGGPTVIAPVPQRICSIVPSLVLTGTAENFASLSWTIFSGPGTVTQSDTNPKEATYYTTPDASVIYTETVVKFTATGIWPCTGSVDSFVTIRVDQKPSAYIEVIAP